jgi:hypothetical protein
MELERLRLGKIRKATRIIQIAEESRSLEDEEKV